MKVKWISELVDGLAESSEGLRGGRSETVGKNGLIAYGKGRLFCIQSMFNEAISQIIVERLEHFICILEGEFDRPVVGSVLPVAW